MGTDPGPFARAALELRGHGLAPIPISPNKTPRIAGFNRWRGPPSCATLTKWAERHGDSNVAILTGQLSRVTIVDVDDAGQVAQAVGEFGDTPLKTRTSRGMHLWFRHAGERTTNLRARGLCAEIKSTGSLAVVPPSIHESGARYELADGEWSDLARLPRMRHSRLLAAPGKAASPNVVEAVQRGARNDTLFRTLLRHAHHCDDLDALLDVARTTNAHFAEPLDDAEVVKTCRSAWKTQTEGRNRVGRGVVEIKTALIDRLLAGGQSDALVLWARLRQSHWNRPSFAISPKAMAYAKVIGNWTPRRYAAARDALEQHGAISALYRGGRCRGDVSEWRFG